MPGGVNSPVRAFKSVHMDPFVVSHAQGSELFDIHGNAYLDYVMSWGPLILGHAHPEIVEAVIKAIEKGTSYGALHETEILLAEKIVQSVPSIKKVRMTNSGTEAAMSAIRLARAATNRQKIIKFDGCYHGHVDALLAKAGSGVATFGISGSHGVPDSVVRDTIVVPYNDLRAVEKVMTGNQNEIACIIVEPIAANMGVVLPKDGFLNGLKQLCSLHQTLLIFDEVITGFRVSIGGAQQVFKIEPDLTILGKIIGGGFPVGALGGRSEIMDLLAPIGNVYQAGTLSGNPIAMRAGLKTLEILGRPKTYQNLNEKANLLQSGFEEICRESSRPCLLQSYRSLMTLFFSTEPVENFDQAKNCDLQAFTEYFQKMLSNNIFIAPSAFEAMFVSTAHNNSDIEKTLTSARKILCHDKI